MSRLKLPQRGKPKGAVTLLDVEFAARRVEKAVELLLKRTHDYIIYNNPKAKPKGLIKL